MFESTTERRGFPGGLRAQLMLGLVVLVVGTMALVALVGVHLARQQVEQSQRQRTVDAAERLAELREVGPPGDILESVGPGDADWAKITVDGGEAARGDLPEGKEPDLAKLMAEADRLPAVRLTHIGGRPYAVAVTADRPDDPTWRVGVARSMDDAYERIAQSRRLLLAYLGIDALFILIVGYAFLTFVVVRPIRAIGVATERAARGDLASHIEILPPNEFGRVGRSFNRMLDELRDNRRELEERVEELDEAYRELEQTQESLIRSEKMASVGQLAAGVAHEIGNPLSALTGYLQMVDDPDLGEERRTEMVERMRGQVDRMQTIIQDLLDYSRDESDREIVAVPLGPCVSEAVDLLAPQPSARSVDIEVDLPDDLPKVRANRDELVQVLVNLLMNAADAIAEADETQGQPDGNVEMSAREEGESVVLVVADDGPGIPEEERQRIFDPFYTTKDPGEGTGLGLAIALRIMDRFGGELTVESEAGEGAVFRLEFRQV
jgi:signal transduction histidine kinase